MHATYLKPDKIASSDYICAECNINIAKYSHTITTHFYKKPLCSWCEADLIATGYWTTEKLDMFKAATILLNATHTPLVRK
jgi:hypothetical protein